MITRAIAINPAPSAAGVSTKHPGRKTTKVLSQEFGRAHEEEIAESMEMTIEKLRFIAKSATSISGTPIARKDSRLGDFIADIENPNRTWPRTCCGRPEGAWQPSAHANDVLRLCHGLDDGSMKTSKIGQIFMTRERIRQIEAKALRNCATPTAINPKNTSSSGRCHGPTPLRAGKSP